jgi:hypothetical protein
MRAASEGVKITGDRDESLALALELELAFAEFGIAGAAGRRVNHHVTRTAITTASPMTVHRTMRPVDVGGAGSNGDAPAFAGGREASCIIWAVLLPDAPAGRYSNR